MVELGFEPKTRVAPGCQSEQASLSSQPHAAPVRASQGLLGAVGMTFEEQLEDRTGKPLCRASLGAEGPDLWEGT